MFCIILLMFEKTWEYKITLCIKKYYGFISKIKEKSYSLKKYFIIGFYIFVCVCTRVRIYTYIPIYYIYIYMHFWAKITLTIPSKVSNRSIVWRSRTVARIRPQRDLILTVWPQVRSYYWLTTTGSITTVWPHWPVTTGQPQSAINTYLCRSVIITFAFVFRNETNGCRTS